MYRIGLFSQMTKTTVKALRYYDEVGLLPPAFVDVETGYRYYTSEQLPVLHRIVELRQIGFSIDEIAAIQSGRDIDAVLQVRKNELTATLQDTVEQLSRLDHYINERKEVNRMDYSAVIKQTPECIVYYKRLKAPDYNSYFNLIPAIGEEVAAANPNLKCIVPEYCYVEYLDGEYREKDINIEYCEAVENFGNETDSIKFKKVPSITVVSVMHKGPYSRLKDAYAFAFRFIEQNGYTPNGFCRESYIDGIWNKEDESLWLTEVQIPVEKK